jgi:chromosomal replication initiation ATPase DnaA
MDGWEGFSQGFSSGFENQKERKLKEMMAMQLSPYQAGALQNDQAAQQLGRDKLGLEKEIFELNKKIAEAKPLNPTLVQEYEYFKKLDPSLTFETFMAGKRQNLVFGAGQSGGDANGYDFGKKVP